MKTLKERNEMLEKRNREYEEREKQLLEENKKLQQETQNPKRCERKHLPKYCSIQSMEAVLIPRNNDFNEDFYNDFDQFNLISDSDSEVDHRGARRQYQRIPTILM